MEITTWNSLILRMRHEAKRILANNKDGVMTVHIRLFTDSCGEPLLWVISDPARIEPSSTAKECISKLFGK